jgi:hypothetical protein
MRYYSFNPITRAFVGEGDAQVSPAEVGVFLLPANATFKVPPAFDPTTQSAVFDNVNWAVIPKPVQAIDEVVFGWMATDLEKQTVLLRLVNENFMDQAAKALGFANIADAVASAPAGPATNQAERDALALKNWRMMVLSKINEWIAQVQGNTNPMPPVKAIMDSMPTFVRVFPDPLKPPQVFGPVLPPNLADIPNVPLNTVLGLPLPPTPQFPALQAPPPPAYPHSAADAFPYDPNPPVHPQVPPNDPNLHSP